MAELAPMIRKRSRPQPRIRKVSLEKEEVAEPTPENEAEAGLPYVLQRFIIPSILKLTFFFRISDLIELRKLRRARQGIDVTKLHKGDAKRRQKRAREGEEGEEEDQLVKPEKGIANAAAAAAAAVDEDEYVPILFCGLFFVLFLLTIEARKQARRLELGGSSGRIISHNRRM